MSAQALKELATGKKSEENASALMKSVAKDVGIGSVKSFFESQKLVLQAVLPKHVNPDRMLRIALGAIRQNPKLLECTIESLFGGVVLCSQFGLEPNTPLGHCYLIPFQNNKRLPNGKTQKVMEVQFIAGYRGLIDLSRRSGQIESISARVVYENDEFDIQYGTVDEIKHKPVFKNRGDIIGYYAVAKLKDGGRQFEFMSVEEVDDVRDGSQNAYKTEWVDGKPSKKIPQLSSPWWKNPTEMGKKTAIRRLFKYLPTSIEMANVIALDEKTEHSPSQDLASVLTGEYSIVSAEEPQGEEYEGEIVNKETGEISPEQQHHDYPVVREAIEKSKTIQEINDAARMINGVKEDLRDELDELAAKKIAEIEEANQGSLL